MQRTATTSTQKPDEGVEIPLELLNKGPQRQGFASPEHDGIGRDAIGNSRFGKEAMRWFVHTNVDVNHPHAKLTFGHVVAAAGDLFGPFTRDDKISRDANGKERSPEERRAKARKAVASMLKAEPRQIGGVIKLFEECTTAFEQFRRDFPDDPPSEFYKKVWKADKETAAIVKWQIMPSTSSIVALKELLALLSANLDHFLPEARTTYLAFHEIAVEYGKMAKEERDEEKKKELINLALVCEGWSGHYLTDSFAAGHIRTPREKLDHASVLCDLLSNAMHNDDGKDLVVSHSFDKEFKEQWIAVGDGRLFDEEGKFSRGKAVHAVTTSLNHLYSVIYDDKPIENEAPSLIPVVVPEEHVKESLTFYYPLLCVDEKNVLRTRMKWKGYYWEWVERDVKGEMEPVGNASPALVLLFRKRDLLG